MKKKAMALLLCTAMTATMLTACGDSNNGSSSQESSQESKTEESKAPEQSAEVTPEALPDAFAHLTFDGEDEGYKAVVNTDTDAPDGGSLGIAEKDTTFVYADGPVGKAIYLDGSYGLDLGLKATNTDAYTVSFWVNAARLSNFGPTLQIGYNIGRAADAGNNVTWMNVTQTEFPGYKGFPIIWSRNEASDAQDGTDCWPWMWSFSDEEHSISGKKEWVMVTVVCSGESQNSPVGSTTAGAQLYLNGQLAYDSQACYSTNGESMGWEGGYTWDATLAPNIMQPGSSEFESYFGINYWDTIFKGFVDDLYVFDSALSAGQVASLYALGDPNVESVAPEAPAVEEEEAEPSVSTVEIVPDESAIDKVGAVDFSNGWWSDWSDSYAINDGETKTVTLKNYSDGINNWDNLVTAFTNTETKGHSAPADQSADYAEYAVVRSDAFGWGDASYAMTSSECSWGDDWAGWLALMTDADIKLTISRSGSELTLDYVFTGADGTEMTEKVVVASTLTADAPCYFFFTCEECYIDIISVE